VGGDGIGEAPGLLDARERAEDLGRDLLVELNVLSGSLSICRMFAMQPIS